MRIIRSSDCRATPWKNGGGATTEIAASPEGASLDTFDWRISMAQVATDGPFSEFAGIDRSLAVIAGSGMVLTVGNAAPITLSAGDEPICFAGDTPTSARLTNGAITDLNVMTRRGRFDHRLRRIVGPASHEFADGEAIALVVSLNGQTMIEAGRDRATLDHGDAAVIDRAAAAGFRIEPATGDGYLVLLRRSRAGQATPTADNQPGSA